MDARRVLARQKQTLASVAASGTGNLLLGLPDLPSCWKACSGSSHVGLQPLRLGGRNAGCEAQVSKRAANGQRLMKPSIPGGTFASASSNYPVVAGTSLALNSSMKRSSNHARRFEQVERSLSVMQWCVGLRIWL
jgi:hypothetical protein